MSLLNDPAAVRREYTTESGLSVRMAAQRNASGPDPWDVALEAVAEHSPQRVLEVGPGLGEFAERMQSELNATVVAVDQSERMVELTAARGVEAVVGDVQALPFGNASFDCAVAAWMLYHVPDLDRGLAELARVLAPGGRLVAVTNSGRNLHELWELVLPNEPAPSWFNAENGEETLRRHFTQVERRDVRGTVTFPDRDAARTYIAASPARGKGASDLPPFDGPLVCSRHVAVFVAETVP